MSTQPEPDLRPPLSAASEPSLSPMLSLPDELLLCIAAKLTKNSDLRRLSLVNKKLRSISQEVLMKDLLMPRNAIVDLLDTLCGRPDLAKKIRSVDLGDYQVSAPGSSDDARLRIFRLDKSTLFRRLRTALDEVNEEGLFTRIVSGILKEQGAIWRPRHQYYLGILVALTPNLKELTIQLPERKEAETFLLTLDGTLQPPKLVDPFEGPGLELLRKKLRVLNLSSVTYRSLQTHNITLQSLVHLVRLTIPLDALIYPNMQSTAPAKALPTRLQVLHIRPCNKNFLFWFITFCSAFFKGSFPRMRMLEISVESCLRSTLLLITQATPPFSSFRNVVYMLERSGLAISMLNNDGTSAGNLLAELDAWLCLSDSESWWAATMELQFSDAVERTESGKPRKRSKSEARRFIRGTLEPPPKPRRICRFDPQVSWKDPAGEGTRPNITFGNSKEKKTKKSTKEKCAFNPEKWAEVLSHHGLSAESKQDTTEPSKPVVQPDSLEQQQEQLQRLSISEGPIFSYTRDLIIAPTISRFDASKWLELEFFPERAAVLSSKAVPSAPKKKDKQVTTPSPARRRSRTPPGRRMKQKVT